MATVKQPLATIKLGGPEGPTEDDLIRCVHCGLCLNYCPTYRETGLEMESPRGRVQLIRAATEGKLEVTEAFRRHVDLCLVCRACETACPSGVKFGRIMEAARGEITAQAPKDGLGGLMNNLVLRQLFPNPARMRLLGRAFRFYQRSGLQSAVRRSGLLDRLPGNLGEAEALLPQIPDQFFRAPAGEVLSAEGTSERRVAFFSGCIMSVAFGPINEATVRVLRHNGCDIVVPKLQTCCGALHVHSGDRPGAKDLAKRNIEAFERIGAEAIVVNAAGCGAMLKEYGELLQHEPEWAERAHEFSSRVKDISEYLLSIPLKTDFGPVPCKATYQDACHLAHAQRIRQQPRTLLKSIPELDLVELRDSDRCCGSAGIYNVVQHDMSTQILSKKVADIVATGAEICVTGNPGCYLQLVHGLQQAGSPIKMMHIVEILDRAYTAEKK